MIPREKSITFQNVNWGFIVQNFSLLRLFTTGNIK